MLAVNDTQLDEQKGTEEGAEGNNCLVVLHVSVNKKLHSVKRAEFLHIFHSNKLEPTKVAEKANNLFIEGLKFWNLKVQMLGAESIMLLP